MKKDPGVVQAVHPMPVLMIAACDESYKVKLRTPFLECKMVSSGYKTNNFPAA